MIANDVRCKVMIAVLIASLGMMWSGATWAQEAEPRVPQPNNYFWQEVAAGSLGALIGGDVGHWLGGGIVCLDRLPPKCWDNAFWESIIGSAVGGVLGVVAVGSGYGVQGNLPLALLGAVCGAAVGRLAYFRMVTMWELSFFHYAAAVVLFAMPTGLGAALGYNVGAAFELQAMTAMEDRLELVSLTARW